jgi:hypothetical protein
MLDFFQAGSITVQSLTGVGQSPDPCENVAAPPTVVYLELQSEDAKMPDETPAQLYFLPKQGRWRGVVTFRVTSWRRFLASPMSWLERLGVVSMAVLPTALGATRIETTVDYNRQEVVHTTQLSKWGMVFFRSTEHFVFHDNGRDLAVRGEQRLWPTWRAQQYRDSRGQIDEAGACASYVFSVVGTTLHQRTEPAGEGLQVYQNTDWSASEFLLHRVSASVSSAGASG